MGKKKTKEQFVDELSAENGRNYKISVLEKYKDDEDIKYLLDFLYNPYIVTGISDKKLNKNLKSAGAPREITDAIAQADEELQHSLQPQPEE